MKYTSYIFFTLFIVFFIVLGSRNNSVPTNESILKVGIASGYAPFIRINEQGDYEGFDIDVITAIAHRLNRRHELVDLGSMSSLFMALNQGSVDALIWGLSITQDRCNKVAMINYQGETLTSYPLIFWNEIPNRIQSIDDMKGMTVCVEPGSSQEAVLSKYPFINLRYTEKIDDALMNIQYNKADAALVEPAIAKKFQARYPQIKIVPVLLAPEECEQGIGIAINKNNITLIKEIADAVASLKQEDIIASLEQKWGIV